MSWYQAEQTTTTTPTVNSSWTSRSGWKSRPYGRGGGTPRRTPSFQRCCTRMESRSLVGFNLSRDLYFHYSMDATHDPPMKEICILHKFYTSTFAKIIIAHKNDILEKLPKHIIAHKNDILEKLPKHIIAHKNDILEKLPKHIIAHNNDILEKLPKHIVTVFTKRPNSVLPFSQSALCDRFVKTVTLFGRFVKTVTISRPTRRQCIIV